jgi:hypothetical protein
MKIISLSPFQTNSVERAFLNGINRGFSKLGDSKSNLVLSKFETDYNLSRNDIFDHPELFSKTLRNIFRFGSSYIEKAMISELIEQFSLEDRNYKQLADVVAEIRSLEYSQKI